MLLKVFSLNPYFIGLPILIIIKSISSYLCIVSILILLDYLFLYMNLLSLKLKRGVVSILILLDYLFLSLNRKMDRLEMYQSLNPYFIGLPILISEYFCICWWRKLSQSLFYWITYSYESVNLFSFKIEIISILILLDYLFLYEKWKI